MSIMKSIKAFLFLLILFSFTEKNYSQYTIYTPEGRSVNAMVLSGTPYYTNEWAQYWINYYSLDATIIGNPTKAYNCHGYAWAVTEGIGNYWIQDDEESEFSSDGAYSNDGQPSYISSSQANATHGCYEPYSDHSIRVIQNGYPVSSSGSQTQVSKWNDGPLVRHGLREDVYAAFYEADEGSSVPINFRILKKTHSGTLSSYSKTWIGAGGKTHTLTGNVTVPSGVTLTIKSGATVSLNSYYLTINGTLVNNGTISPNIIVKDASNNIKGYYSSLATAVANATSGQTAAIAEAVAPVNSAVTVGNGVTLQINSGVYVTISSPNYIKCLGTGAIVNNGTITPSNILVKQGATITGYYTTVASACANAISGQTVRINASASLGSNASIASGVTLEVASGCTLTMNGYKITAPSGSFTVASGSVITPNIRRTTNTDNIVGLYPTIQSAVDDASSSQRVWLAATTYTENVSLKSSVALRGQGRGEPPNGTQLTGNVTFSNVSGADIESLYLVGGILVNGGTDNDIYNLYFRDMIDINYGSGHFVGDCRHYAQTYNGRLDVYQTSVTAINYENYYGFPTSGVAGGSGTLTMYGYCQLKWLDYGLRAYSGLNADLSEDIEMCNNTLDVQAMSGADVDITLGDGTFSACDSMRIGGAGSISWNTCISCGGGKAAYEPSTLASSDNDDSADALLFKEAKAYYNTIQKAIHEARKNGEKKERQEYRTEYTKASDAFRKLASTYPESRYVPFALHMLSFIAEELGESGSFITWAEKELAKAKTLPVKTGLLQALAHASVAAGQFEKAVEYSDALAETSTDIAQVESALYGKGQIYQYFLGDKEKAAQAYNDAIASNPQSQYAESIAIDLAREGGKVEEKPIEEVTESEGFSLGSFPNPANPTTTIVYTLPEASDVLVQVFDVRGRLVQILVNGTQETGSHTVLWNGADGEGIAASSGMYFCRLQAGEKVLTRKMLLVR